MTVLIVGCLLGGMIVGILAWKVMKQSPLTAVALGMGAAAIAFLIVILLLVTGGDR